MKRPILYAIVMAFITFNAAAQAEPSYGVRLGANVSSISTDDLPEDLEDSRFGIVVGFLAEYPISEKWSIQPEFQYSSQGNDDKALRVDYLQLPVFLKYNFTYKFNIHLGPQAGLKIWEWEDNTEIEPDFNTFDFAGVIGLGVNITENFFADVRYAFGLSNIIDDEGVDASSRNIQLSFGYKL